MMIITDEFSKSLTIKFFRKRYSLNVACNVKCYPNLQKNFKVCTICYFMANLTICKIFNISRTLNFLEKCYSLKIVWNVQYYLNRYEILNNSKLDISWLTRLQMKFLISHKLSTFLGNVIL